MHFAAVSLSGLDLHHPVRFFAQIFGDDPGYFRSQGRDRRNPEVSGDGDVRRSVRVRPAAENGFGRGFEEPAPVHVRRRLVAATGGGGFSAQVRHRCHGRVWFVGGLTGRGYQSAAPGQAPVHRPADSRGSRAHRRSGWQRPAGWGSRGTGGARPQCDAGLFQSAGGNGADAAGRLAAHRRPSLSGRGRVSVHQRPAEGHDYHPWREYLPPGDRGAVVPLSRRGRGGGNRPARSDSRPDGLCLSGVSGRTGSG